MKGKIVLNIEKLHIETKSSSVKYVETGYYLIVGGIVFFIDIRRSKELQNIDEDKQTSQEDLRDFQKHFIEARSDTMSIKLIESNRSLDLAQNSNDETDERSHQENIENKLQEREKLIQSMKELDEQAYFKALKLYADHKLDIIKQQEDSKNHAE
jgi:hypothetical protein